MTWSREKDKEIHNATGERETQSRKKRRYWASTKLAGMR
jgi:hypothetical protein